MLSLKFYIGWSLSIVFEQGLKEVREFGNAANINEITKGGCV